MSIEYATGLDVGDRKRRQNGINEDSIAVNLLETGHLNTTQSAGVFVLADGAGGEKAGELASYIATVEVTRRLTEALWDTRTLDDMLEEGPSDSESLAESLGNAVVQNRDPEWVLTRIETAIQSTHTEILHWIQDLGLEGAYTTIVAGVKIGHRLYYGWVGDSRLYIVNDHPNRDPERQLSLLTRDHSLVNRLLEQGEIDEVEAHVHRQGNQITRALGGTAGDDPAGSTVQIDTGHVPLFSDDIILFTSDGLVDAYADAPALHEQYTQDPSSTEIADEILEKSVTDDEIRDLVLDAESLDTAVERFVSLANRRGGKDNLSLVLFRDRGLAESPPDGIPVRGVETVVESMGDRETLIRDGTLDER